MGKRATKGGHPSGSTPARELKLPRAMAGAALLDDLDPDWVNKAMTHSSYADQNRLAEDNERMEFLGDAVVELLVTKIIYEEHPELKEGRMSKTRSAVVNTKAHADLARHFGLQDRIKLGKGEEQSHGRTKTTILADAYEALVAAVYLTSGFEGVIDSFGPLYRKKIKDIVRSGKETYDFKTKLQEVAVARFKTVPSYKVSGVGADHDRVFTARVKVVYGTRDVFMSKEGKGRSKKQAEQQAAKAALKVLGEL